MSLATSPVRFSKYTSNYAATPSLTPGTTFTAGGLDTDGAAVSCIAALAHDVHHLRLRFQGIQSTGADTNSAGDLLIDPAGGTSWAALINDVVCGMLNTNTTGMPWSYEFPIYIPAGASLGWRCKTVNATDVTTGQILVETFGEPSNPAMWWCGQGVETLGISNSKGTAITPGNSGAAGSWTNVGSTTSRIYKAIQLGLNGSDAGAIDAAYHFEVGAGSQPIPGSGIVWLRSNTSELAYRHNPGLMTCNIPSGTQMQVRGTCSTTAEVLYAALYGVY